MTNEELEKIIAILGARVIKMEQFMEDMFNAVGVMLDFQTKELLKSHIEGLRFMEKENRKIGIKSNYS